MGTSTDSASRMQCMEVWGGNRETERSFELPGVKVWVNSSPDGQAVAGGDVYYLSSCASGRITRALLADVSGHGEAAAEVAIGLRDLMRRFVNVIQQDKLVIEMNQRFSEYAADSHFATAIVATYFAPTRALTLSNAGHPPPMVYHSNRKEWSEIERPERNESTIADTPLGVFDDAEYNSQRIRLESGDRVFCYSDAVTEAVRTDGTMLGVEGVQQILTQLANVKSDDFVKAFLDAVDLETNQAPVTDDRTVILLESNESRSTLTNNLLAPFRLLRSPTLNTELQ